MIYINKFSKKIDDTLANFSEVKIITKKIKKTKKKYNIIYIYIYLNFIYLI
jgi:hypothetical protein